MVPQINFTKRTIEALPTPEKAEKPKRDEYRDSKSRGLMLYVSPSGLKVFYLYRKINGRPERIRLGVFPDTTVEHARKQASRLNAAVYDGANPAEAKRMVRAEPTLGELYEAYMDQYVRPERLVAKDIISRYKRHLRQWQSRKLSAITPAQAKKLHQRLAVSHSGVTANRVLTQLRGMYNKARDLELYGGENPTDRIKLFPEKSRERFLQPEEAPRFFTTLSKETNSTFRDFVLIALLTGARKTNVLNMRWEQINFHHAMWTIPKTKNGDSHTVPLVDQAMEILQERQANSKSDWVLPGSSASGHYADPKKAWAGFLKRADIKNLWIHDLRRTMGSWQAITGASLVVIGKSLAHKDVATTATYARLNVDPVRASMSKAAGALFAAGGEQDTAEVIQLGKA